MEKEEINVMRPSLAPMEEYVRLLEEIWKSRKLDENSRFQTELQEKLRRMMQAETLELFSNGQTALEILLEAMALPKGSEVITTPFAFASTVHAIVRSGLKPVFCDINDRNFTLDIEKLESRITENTSAILPVHAFGNVCDVSDIQDIADRHHLKVIYDAADAFGETCSGRQLGEFGDATVFSFHEDKVFNTAEGAAVVLGRKNEALEEKLRLIRHYGMLNGQVVCTGTNAGMNELCAALGLCNLNYIEDWTEKRKKIFEEYSSHLSNMKGVILPMKNHSISYNYAYMPVMFHGFDFTRDQVYDNLLRYGIHARKAFFPCANAYDCYRDRYDTSKTPVAERASREILTLPIYPELESSMVDRICQIILNGKPEDR